ncbi:MAG TPA: NAD/NADP octopine/nopaline dehydrogenase family protein [Candidatus Ratteibacteria bacterium]|nr:NAD/NADP octopine/nopaline dehydrogenase family protein [Candidatus Ratteibacteria bacterium]
MDKNIKFAVIGAGAGGLSMAVHLSLMGNSVNLFNRSRERIEVISRNGAIEVKGIFDKKVRVNQITSDIKESLKGVDIIIVIVPAFAHKDIAKLVAPYLENGQIILLMPGRTLGAIEFSWILKNMGVKEEVFIVETQTILHTCIPLENLSGVKILGMKKQIYFSTFPSKYNHNVLKILKSIFPQFIPSESVLKTSLGNVGCILHPAPTLLNAGWIENSNTKFKYYYEGITPSIAKFLEKMDEERLKVAEQLGVNIPSIISWFSESYGVKGQNLYNTLQKTKPYADILAPENLNHRYIWEDVPTGLVPISSLGKSLGVKTTFIDIIIELANKICEINFRKSGRDLKKFGIDNINKKDVKKIVKYGY